MAADPSRLGRYRVLGRLGEGHFGAVWLAEGDFPDGPRRVAIKQLTGAWSFARFETLVHEYELLALVRHPSICRAFEFLDRESAVVLEFVDGLTLRALLERAAARGDRIPPDVAARIGQEVVDCLVHAHDTPGPDGRPLALVHRDLKPENVMLTPRGEVKVLDFGLAAERGTGSAGEGTPLYMSPEQARGEPVTAATDQFAIGLVLFELLTGGPAHRVPSSGSDGHLAAFEARVASADFGDALARLAETEPDLGPIVARCLAADPRDRWPDGRALRLALGGPARRASLARFAALAFGGTDRGRIPPAEGVHSPMANPPDPIRPAGPPPPGGGNRPRPTAARPPPKPKMWAPGEKPPSPTSPAAGAPPGGPASPPRPPPGQDLAMVPLSQEEEAFEPAGASTTNFFSRPKPRKSANAEEDEPIAALRRVDPIAVASAPAPGPAPGAYGGPVAYAAPVAPMTPMAPMMPLGIQGPVAGGMPGMYGAGPHSAQLPPDLQQDVQRAQSYRVAAVVLGLMFMVFSVTIVTVVLTVGFVMYGNQPAPKDKEVAVGPITPVAPPPLADTGEPKLPPPPLPTQPVQTGPKPPKPKNPNPQPSAPAPAPVSAGGQVTLSLAPGSPGFTSVEVKCPSGFRERADFVGGVAKVPGVPSESCDAIFKGGPPAKTKVSGGDSKSCTFEGGGAVANCR